MGYPDTGWYEKLAREILSGDFRMYDGARTPIYPIILIVGLFNKRLTDLFNNT